MASPELKTGYLVSGVDVDRLLTLDETVALRNVDPYTRRIHWVAR